MLVLNLRGVKMNRDIAAFAARLCALALLLSLALPGEAISAKPAMQKKFSADSASLDKGGAAGLDDIVSGLAQFESRASRYSPDEWNLVLGYASYRHGQYDNALKLLAGSASKFPIAADHVLFYRAASASRTGDPKAALALLDELDISHPDSVWGAESKLERARALISLGRGREARAAANEGLRKFNQEEAFEAQKLIARSYIVDGDAQAASGLVRNLAVSADGEGELAELYQLIAEIKKRFGEDIGGWLSNPEQQFRIAQSFASASQWDEAVVRLEGLLAARGLDSGMRTQARWLLARGLRWTHRYDEAIKMMEELMGDPNARGFSDSLMNTLAITYTKRDDYARAIALRKRMMQGASPGSARAADMAYRIAFLVMDEGKYEEAIPLWREVISNRNLAKRENAEWYLAWSHYMAGRYQDAVALFDGMLKRKGKKSGIYDRLSYWKGRALEKQGNAAQSRAAFELILRERPGGYYAELSSRRLKGEKRSAADFARVSGPSGGGSARYDAVSIDGRSHLARAAFFDRLGLHEEAAREIRAAPASNSEAVMVLARRNFAHDVAYRLAEGHRRGELRGDPVRGGGGRLVWEAAYPRAYEPLVSTLARKSAVEPAFIWSIMRNESTFRPEVVSPAGAVGLMQLMPATANRMASEAGMEGFDRRDLFRPAANMSLGIAYLKKLSVMFPENPVAWAASYNAGEEAVSRWMKKKSLADIEEWIEEIPYDETNLYAKKVMLSCWKYQKLYGR